MPECHTRCQVKINVIETTRRRITSSHNPNKNRSTRTVAPLRRPKAKQEYVAEEGSKGIIIKKKKLMAVPSDVPKYYRVCIR